MNDTRQTLLERRRIIVEKAVYRLLPRLRILQVVGAVLVALGSLALAAAALPRVSSLVPIGILMAVGGLFEMGAGQVAREDTDNSPLTPWIMSGGCHMAAGAVAIFALFLPASLVTPAIGVLLLFAGITWMRAGFALPERFQASIVPLCGGITACAGLLLLSRWTGGNQSLLAIVLGCEMLVRGWSWLGFALGLSKGLKR